MLSSFSFCRVVYVGFIACCGIAATVHASTVSAAMPPAARATLSVEGSGRATAYSDQHKIITVQDKTHVVWLDADQLRFLVRGRTLDRTTGQWSEVVTIGEAQDNHGGRV